MLLVELIETLYLVFTTYKKLNDTIRNVGMSKGPVLTETVSRNHHRNEGKRHVEHMNCIEILAQKLTKERHVVLDKLFKRRFFYTKHTKTTLNE